MMVHHTKSQHWYILTKQPSLHKVKTCSEFTSETYMSRCDRDPLLCRSTVCLWSAGLH